jgi:hypothetical protein
MSGGRGSPDSWRHPPGPTPATSTSPGSAKAPSSAEFAVIVERIKVLVLLDLPLFVVIFVCMIAMHFSL